jgi:hypothetical protein
MPPRQALKLNKLEANHNTNECLKSGGSARIESNGNGRRWRANWLSGKTSRARKAQSSSTASSVRQRGCKRGWPVMAHSPRWTGYFWPQVKVTLSPVHRSVRTLIAAGTPSSPPSTGLVVCSPGPLNLQFEWDEDFPWLKFCRSVRAWDSSSKCHTRYKGQETRIRPSTGRPMACRRLRQRPGDHVSRQLPMDSQLSPIASQ